MKEKYALMLRQNKLWAIAALILPTVSTLVLLLLIFFQIDTYIKITAMTIGVVFFTVASYWWWWTMYQLYKFTKTADSTEEKIETLGNEFRSIKEDIKNL